MEINNDNILNKSYNYLDSLFVYIKNSVYDVFIEFVDEEEVGCFVYESQYVNNPNNLGDDEVNIEYDKLPMILGESTNGTVDLDEELDPHNTAFISENDEIDWDKIDWNDPRNDAYYDPHDECVEYPGFLHDNDGYGGYGSNYNGGYDSY
jgi:hypothetical protein